MKAFKCLLTVLLGAVLVLSCEKKEQGKKVYTITVDRDAIKDVAANNPGVEALVITTDAPYWVLTAPDWVTPDTKQGVGGGKSTIVSLTIASNYKNEATETFARSGEIKISGGNTSVTVPINQLGHKAVIDPNASIGGIPTLAEFLDFVACVNSGEAPIRWMNSKMEVELQTDIDLATVENWTPIGNVESSGNGNNASAAKGDGVFSSVFNGGGHTIRNFKATKELAAGETWGLFGYISHATIKNLNVEADITLSATGAADAGVVVGTAFCSTIENVHVTAKVTSTAGASTGARFAVGGVVGFMFSVTDSDTVYDSYVKDCEVTATVNMVKGNNTGNGATGVIFTGIMDKETACGGQGAVITVDPVKAAATNDFTLVNGVVISAGVGAPKWNPSYVGGISGDSFLVKNVDEFTAAIEAGKTDIKFAAGEYDLSAAEIAITAGLHLSGEAGAVVKVKQVNFAEGELGNIVIEDLAIVGDDTNNLFNVAAASVVKNLTVRNCDISHIKKSVLYGNADGSSFGAVVFSNNIFTTLGGGQGTFDIRKGEYGIFTVENCTIVGGRDFIRADAGKVTRAVNIVNNTFDSVTLSNNNGILYVRSTPDTYVVKNNLFLNENGDNNRLSGTNAAIQIPSTVAGNYFYNCTAEAFWTGVITKEAALANGGVELTASPVKDAATGDYTLVDAVCLASNVGAARWNPNAGRVSSEITVSTVPELVTALDAGKAAITLKAGTYDLRTIEGGGSGIVTLTAPVSLSGKGIVEVIGGFKLSAGTTSFFAEKIKFNGAEKAIGLALEVSETVEISKIQAVDCEFIAYNKGVFYGNGTDSKIGIFDLERNLVHGFGTGQGMIDIRKGAYTAINVSQNTFYDGGRDFVRCDANIAGTIAITNNTFGACSVGASNGLLWVRSCATTPEKYVVKNNLFLNIDGTSLLAKTGATVPTMSGNYFFNVADGFFGGAIDETTATTAGAKLDADPCTASATFDFTLTNATLRNADVGDPRWNSASANYRAKGKK